uniref:Uncharacterized protein n=1 Tax=Ditylum brightwellii TaxID=49249 RepID=A0A6V2QNM8_9STRA|mmetsp:Transcript_322/g.382  ORF Transcript_322/g.382 Transcript_322/m.382 type:complete len:242 (-) Transcript_322:386-1111(-)
MKRCVKLPSISFKSKKLHRYLLTESWASACARCQTHPKEAARWTHQAGFYEGSINTKVLPIHIACALGAPVDVVDSLIEAYPESAREQETCYGRMPLHLACIYHVPLGVVNLLLSRFPSGAYFRDAVGRTPIFYACTKGPSVDLIEALLDACPDAAKTVDYKGWLPIHVACHMGASDDVILKLLDAYPSSAMMRTNSGSLPKLRPELLAHWNERWRNPHNQNTEPPQEEPHQSFFEIQPIT